MGPINRGPGPLLGMRMTLPGMRPPPPLLSRFRPRLPPPGMPPMRMPSQGGGRFPPMRQRMPPPPHPPLMQQRIPPPMQQRMPHPPMQQRMPPPMQQRMPPPMQQRMPPLMQQRMPPPMQQRMPPPMQQRMPPPMQQRMPPPIRQRMPPPRPGTIMRPGGPLPLFGPRVGCGPPPMMGPRGPRGPPLRPGPRGMPPHMLMRPRFPQGNNTIKNKGIIIKKVNKLEELDLKKPWMTDAIRMEVQKKNKLYTKARKSKDAKEWENFKDLRNKVTRMIRDAKNEYLEKYPEKRALIEKQDDDDEMMNEDENFDFKTEEDEEIVIEESENTETLQESINEQDHIKCQETVQLVAAQN